MYLYCILAVEARDARAPQSHNWSYNQLKAALLLLRLILWSFAARALEICKSQHLRPFSAQEQKRKIEVGKISGLLLITHLRFHLSSVIIVSRRCPWRFCNGQKCYEAFATGINVTKLYMGQAVYASSVGHFLSAQIATCSPQRAIALHETGGTFLHTPLAVHCRPSVLQSHSSKSYLSFSLAAFQRENFPQSTYFRQFLGKKGSLQDSGFSTIYPTYVIPEV